MEDGNISMKDSSILIIPNEEELVIEPHGIYAEKFDYLVSDHAKKYRTFCEKYLPQFVLPDRAIGPDYGKLLAKFGHLSCIGSIEFNELYLPAELSCHQKEWLRDNFMDLFSSCYLETSIWVKQNDCLMLKEYYCVDGVGVIPDEIKDIVTNDNEMKKRG